MKGENGGYESRRACVWISNFLVVPVHELDSLTNFLAKVRFSRAERQGTNEPCSICPTSAPFGLGRRKTAHSTSPNTTNWGPTPTMYSRSSLRSGHSALRCLQCGQRRGLAGNGAPASQLSTTTPSLTIDQLPPRAPSHTRLATPLAPSLRVETFPALQPPSL